MTNQEDKPATVSPEQQLEVGRTFLQGVYERMGLNVTVSATREPNQMVYLMDGQDREKLRGGIGLTGGGLPRALRTLVSMALPRCEEGRSSVALEIEGDEVRGERDAKMEEVASFLGGRVSELGVSVLVLGMNSADRRNIHRCLADRDDLETESQGFGAFRRLKIQAK
mgnify:CR=1 FL=1